MKMPHSEGAYVPEGKLKDYLLSDVHPVGAPKARWLRSVGFDHTSAATLEAHLIAIARSEEVVVSIRSPHGMKFVLDGTLPVRTGRPARIRTVWIIDDGSERPRFVTAYPA